MAAAVVLILVLGIAAGGWYLLRRPGPAPPSDAGEAPVAVETTPPVADDTGPAELPAGESPVDPQGEALAMLETLSQRDLTGVSLNGQHVAQLASKYPGIYDGMQTTDDGSHTFEATDVLAEHQRLRDDPANGNVRVVLLKSTDYGKRQLVDGQALYVTFAIGGFRSEADVRSWCAERFAELSGTARENQCAARRLRPPA